MNLSRYTANDAREWDEFVTASKNGTFLFRRGYMDYHSQRFCDHSLMFRNEKDQLIAVLPANEADGMLYSHQGLTYGGLILAKRIHVSEVGEIFDAIRQYLRSNGMTELVYKCVPHIYHTLPAEEDEYWLWCNGATLAVCNISSTLPLNIPQDEYKKMLRATKLSDYNQLLRRHYTIQWDAPLEAFWPLLTDNLQRSHQVTPVHTLEEMTRLKAAFPKEIICVTALNENGVVEAGALLYFTATAVHTQYMSASVEGKQSNALDFLIISIINQLRQSATQRYFDFGHSNEQAGQILNAGLIAQKEGFGARGVVYKQYILPPSL